MAETLINSSEMTIKAMQQTILELQRELSIEKRSRAGIMSACRHLTEKANRLEENNKLGQAELAKRDKAIAWLLDGVHSYNLSEYQDGQRCVLLNNVKVVMKGQGE